MSNSVKFDVFSQGKLLLTGTIVGTYEDLVKFEQQCNSGQGKYRIHLREMPEPQQKMETDA